MSTQLLIYENVVPLSKQRHADWSVEVGKSFSFTRDLNALPLLAAEFGPAHREYPIVFRKVNEQIQPACLLGMREKENLYLTDSEGWSAEYLPAFLRRYPFVFARSQVGKTFTLCIDEAHPGFNQEGDGERLFDQDGEPTPYVKNVLSFLQNFQADQARTQAFCRKLDELEVFEAKNAIWNNPKGEKVALTGMLCVDRKKLTSLPPKVLAGMIESGEMDLIYAHLWSLHNFERFKEGLSRGG